MKGIIPKFKKGDKVVKAGTLGPIFTVLEVHSYFHEAFNLHYIVIDSTGKKHGEEGFSKVKKAKISAFFTSVGLTIMYIFAGIAAIACAGMLCRDIYNFYNLILR